MIINFKKVNIQIFLFTVFTLCIVLSNILSIKTITLISIHDAFNIKVTLPCIIIFPTSFIISDIVSECYGYKASRYMAWLGFICSLITALILHIQSFIPSDTDLSILSNTWIMTVASLIAYLLSGWINDLIFDKMKKQNLSHTHIISRCLLSSFIGQIIDSFVFLALSMYILPLLIYRFCYMSMLQLLITAICQIIIKLSFEVFISPLTKSLCIKIHKIINYDN